MKRRRPSRARLGLALRRLDPESRALLDLSLRRRRGDRALAELMGIGEAEVSYWRNRTLRSVAAGAGLARAEPARIAAALRGLPDRYWIGVELASPTRRLRARALTAALLLCGAAALIGALATLNGSRGAAQSAPVAGTNAAPPATRIAAAEPGRDAPPARLQIPAVGLEVEVEPVGAAGRAIAVPEVDRAGWYSGGPRPGEPGRTVMIGHRDTLTGPAVFASLPQVRPGMTILVTSADGRRHRYVAVRSDEIEKRSFAADRVYAPTPRPTLVLITCDGGFDAETGYESNFLVYARRGETLQ